MMQQIDGTAITLAFSFGVLIAWRWQRAIARITLRLYELTSYVGIMAIIGIAVYISVWRGMR